MPSVRSPPPRSGRSHPAACVAIAPRASRPAAERVASRPAPADPALTLPLGEHRGTVARGRPSRGRPWQGGQACLWWPCAGQPRQALHSACASMALQTAGPLSGVGLWETARFGLASSRLHGCLTPWGQAAASGCTSSAWAPRIRSRCPWYHQSQCLVYFRLLRGWSLLARCLPPRFWPREQSCARLPRPSSSDGQGLREAPAVGHQEWPQAQKRTASRRERSWWRSRRPHSKSSRRRKPTRRF